MQKETSLKEYSAVHNAIITLGDTDDSGKGRHFKSRFIQPGVAGYPGQFGNVLITKESLDKFINTMVGVPVIINHKDLNTDNVNDERVGVVNSVWYDEKDGWYWCDGIIWDETAQNLITDKNWSVSCSYDVKTANDEGGSENNIPYDMEFLDGVFTHLALVDNPRYERANIVFNSKTFNISNNNFNPDQKRDEKGRWTKEDYNAEIDKVIAGQYPRGKQIRVKDKPSDVWLNSGLQDAEMMLPVAVYEKSTTEKHNVSEETMRNLPDLLDNPLYIFKSSTQPNSFVGVLDDFEDDNGIKKPLIAAVKPVGGQTEVNILTSVYGKDADFINRETLKGNLLYDKSQNNKAALNSIVASIATETSKPSIDIINYVIQNFNPNVKEHEEMNIENDKWITKYDKEGEPYHVNIDDTDEVDDYNKNETKSKETKMYDEARAIIDFVESDKPLTADWAKRSVVFKEKYGKTVDEVFLDMRKREQKEGKKISFESFQKIFPEARDTNELAAHAWFEDDNGNKYLATYSKVNRKSWDLMKGEVVIKKTPPGEWQRTKEIFRGSDLNRLNDFIKRNKIKKINNNKETEMALLDELKKLITKVENEKGDNMDDKEKQLDNEKVDKRKLIDEVGGILKGKVDDEVIRTIIGKMEKMSYDKSEAGTADNEKEDDKKEDKKDDKKVENESEKDKKEVKEIKEDVKEDVENKCKNSVDNSKPDYFGRLNEIYNAVSTVQEKSDYVSRADREQAAVDYFSK